LFCYSDQKFTDYESKIIYGANDKSTFDDETCHDKGMNNDVNDLNSVQFSDQDTMAYDTVPPSPVMASFTALRVGHQPNEHYVEISAPAGTLGLTIGTFS
jgi:hypothetical protein